MAHVYISIGSNLEGPVERVRRAVEALRACGTVVAVSPLYRTAPWGPVRDQPEFVNAVVALDTHLTPHDLLLQLKTIERQFGRSGKGERFGPRELDLDILTYDDVRLDEEDLVLPHPRMNQRAFVMVPLADLDEAYVAMRDALPPEERRGVTRL